MNRRFLKNVNILKDSLGHGLLKHALLKILDASRTIGIRAVLVQAINQRAADWFARYGFVPAPTNPFHLLLLLKDCAGFVADTLNWIDRYIAAVLVLASDLGTTARWDGARIAAGLPSFSNPA